MTLFIRRYCIFFLLLLCGVTLEAQVVSDSNTGFSINMSFPQTSACIVYPNKSYDADVCPIDNYLFPTEDASMIARGVIRFEPGEMLFNLAHIKAPFTAPMNQKEAESFIVRYLELFNAYESETLDSGMVLVNEQPFYRYYGDVGSDTALPYPRVLFYAFSGKGYHYFISFNFDASQEKKAFEASDHILRTIKVPLPEHSERGELLYQVSYEVVFSISLFLSLFLILSLLNYLFQRRLLNKSFIQRSALWQKMVKIFELQGISRFIALSVLIVGIYEMTVVFRTWEAVVSFLSIYVITYTAFIFIRLLWRLINGTGFSVQKDLEMPSAALFFPVGIPKLIVLSIFTFGLYSFYWFYKNWLYVQRTEKNPVYPLLKAIFYPLCAYFLFKRIRRFAIESQSGLTLHAGFWSVVLAACYLIDMIPLGNLVSQWALLILGLLVFFLEFAVLIPVQSVINQLNKQFAPAVDLNQHFKKMDGVVCVIGAGLLTAVFYLLYSFWRLQ